MSLELVVDNIANKTCAACRETKSAEKFPRNRSYKDGLNSSCKDCHQLRNHNARSKNPLQSKARTFLTHARGKGNFIADDFTADYLVSLFEKHQNCQMCTRPLLEYIPTTGQGNGMKPGKVDLIMSVDKINPALGYRRDNVTILCRSCNRWKGDITLKQARWLVKWLEPRWIAA